MIKVMLLFFIVLYGCAHSRNAQSTVEQKIKDKSDSRTYRVYKIDSINSYYLIYAKRNDTLFKIVSKKEVNLACTNIVLGSNYLFSLNSIWNTEIKIGNVNISPSITPQVNCLKIDDSTKICLERDSINDLHYARNVKGLCIQGK